MNRDSLNFQDIKNLNAEYLLGYFSKVNINIRN